MGPASREQAGPGRGAHGAGSEVSQMDSGGREPIEVGSLDFCAATEADVAVAEIVGQENEDVGRSPWFLLS